MGVSEAVADKKHKTSKYPLKVRDEENIINAFDPAGVSSVEFDMACIASSDEVLAHVCQAIHTDFTPTWELVIVTSGGNVIQEQKAHHACVYSTLVHDRRAKATVLLGDSKEEHELRSRKFTLDIDLTTFSKMIIAVAKKMYGDSEGDEFKLCFMTEGGNTKVLFRTSIKRSATCQPGVVRAKEHGALSDGHGVFVLRQRSIMRAVQGKDTKKGHWRSKLKNQKKSLPDFKGTLLRQPKKKGKAAESHVQVQTETSLQLDSTSQDKTYDDNITLNKAYNSNAQEKQPTNEQGYKDNAIRKHHSTTRQTINSAATPKAMTG
ncbi:hypothetical protein SARC_04836 [Sphaeroforma arctica JP610]|uniref:Uncharacterized protein n=1 Tax=Sphaeroforma arctica JP610 TaxID=667725 RepID=A0A0L0G3U8_9EUKA|nr:hypothetical protein SARC_04836 [Sphaeroforma arctica JP610]KNC82893.1 hypothetical protein SARC_04836 [Sphaeroforma arctica JP610]|eukprot:XP_014156795.1 hypothetical protein SARC_04836 [Sphaeroforma arctica JP610]